MNQIDVYTIARDEAKDASAGAWENYLNAKDITEAARTYEDECLRLYLASKQAEVALRTTLADKKGYEAGRNDALTVLAAFPI